MKYIIDLDDTLVYSTILNNDAYNYALEQYDLPRIKTTGRITRDNINNVNLFIRNKIIDIKQEYFSLEWLKYRLVINQKLVDKLKIISSKNCFLWTKANKERTFTIIKECDLMKYFTGIIFDQKVSFENSKRKILKIVKSENFVIYENNHSFFKDQDVKIIDIIKDKYFDIAGYEIYK